MLFDAACRYISKLSGQGVSELEKAKVSHKPLGNAIRRFETYVGDRYLLDSQLLWHHLTASVPERTVAAVDKARTNVDWANGWSGILLCVVRASALISAAMAGWRRILSRQRRRVGQMLPTGMPSLALISV